jgi:hypothetical protein
MRGRREAGWVGGIDTYLECHLGIVGGGYREVYHGRHHCKENTGNRVSDTMTHQKEEEIKVVRGVLTAAQFTARSRTA